MRIQRYFIVLFLPLITSITLASCRSESDMRIEAPQNQVIELNSKVVHLISKVSMNDGSVDNIIDNTTCHTVKLPVTVIINEQEVIIDSAEDIQEIENLFAESNDSYNSIDFVYPITITYDDYSEDVIENYSELIDIRDTCIESEETISCVDFIYPFTISVFDSQSELLEIIRPNSDKELYTFITTLKESDIASIDFPISVVYENLEEFTVNDIDELETVIEVTIISCGDNDENEGEDDEDDEGDENEGEDDEDDEGDENDDDEGDDDVGDDDEDDNEGDDGEDEEVTVDVFIDTITIGTWEVQKFKDNQNTETQNYEGYIFTFSDNGSVSVQIGGNGEFLFGEWSASENEESGVDVRLNFITETILNKFNKNNWDIKGIENDIIMLEERNEDEISKDELFFKQI